MRRRLWPVARAVLASVGLLLLLVTFTPLVRMMATPLSSTWTETNEGVLIVLGGGPVSFEGAAPKSMGESSYWRAIHALAVWRAGHFRTLLLAGAGAGETMKPFLVANGVPEPFIVVEERSGTTHENAQFVKPMLANMEGPFVLLTSDYHTWRARHCFAKEKIRVETLPAPDVLKRTNSLGQRWQCFWDVSLELVKIGYYRFKGWI